MFGRTIDIVEALENRDEKKIRKALKNNPDAILDVTDTLDIITFKAALPYDTVRIVDRYVEKDNTIALSWAAEDYPATVVDRVIAAGALDMLKELVGDNPAWLEEYFSAPGYKFGSLVHVAAWHNQPEIIDYLVTEKGMEVDNLQKNGWSPLHFAASKGRIGSLKKLIALGADPDLVVDGQTPYEMCEDANGKKAILLARAEKEKRIAEEKQHGVWASPSADEVTFTRELNGYRLTNIFNFATKSWVAITKDLENGQSVPETKTFNEATEEMITQARDMLHKLNGTAAAPAAAPAEKPLPTTRPFDGTGYDKLRRLGH